MYPSYKLGILLSLTGCSSSYHPQAQAFSTKFIETPTIAAPEVNPCSDNMAHVKGQYCTKLDHTCLEKLDKKRCKVYDKNPVCSGPEKELNFCMDINEFTVDFHTKIPVHNVSWVEADVACRVQQKRLCTSEEFVLACEGPERYPYSYGFERILGVCNIDIFNNLKANGKLVDHTQPIDLFPNCISSYGIHNMTGNVTEWVSIPGQMKPWRSGLMGGWWSNRIKGECRPLVNNHFEYYADIQVGFRCCSDIEIKQLPLLLLEQHN